MPLFRLLQFAPASVVLKKVLAVFRGLTRGKFSAEVVPVM
jgi:hypothetical protein